MKQDLYYTKVQQRMKKGVLVLDGFLGNDKRNLIDIINEDNETVKRLGLTHIIIAEKLDEFREVGLKALEESVIYKDHFEIKAEIFRGKLPCPFGEKGIYQKSEITVINKKINEQIKYSDLSIHLIKEHGFYQGIGSPYRLDPKKVVRVLEIS
ncbi:MAG: hypothetical protein GYA61_04230 [Spirochaetales bacterium]|jgi:hypothetical protein|nr:hypothetical protein [Exilispira sp.]NMC67417.1 hypothetical protein [Spirochaetales bacterium]